MTGQDKRLERLLSVGEVILLHLNPFKRWGMRHRAVVRGWYVGSHIILDRPCVRDRLVRLQKEEVCVVRFLAEGKACGFTSSILDWDNRPEKPTCMLAWPKKYDMVSFRRFERIQLDLPCTIASGDQQGTGEVRDLSVSGCLVFTLLPVPEHAEIALSFTLPDGLPVEHLRATVRNLRPAHGGYCLGCELAEGQEHLQSDMAFFLAAALERADLTEAAAPRLFIIDKDPLRASAFRSQFEQEGWEVFIAGSAVEGLLRLRMLPPAALLIHAEQEELLAADMLRLLKSTRGLERLPLFVCGASGSQAGENPAESGLAGCFPASWTAARVREAVLSYVTGSGPQG